MSARATVRSLLSWSPFVRPVDLPPQGARIADVLAKAGVTEHLDDLMFIVDGHACLPDDVLHDGDELTVFSVLSCG